MEQIHERLRSELEAKGLSAAQAARDAGEPDSQGLRDVLAGRKRLSAELLGALVTATGIDGDYVLTGVTEAESLRQRDALHEAGGLSKGQRAAHKAEVELLANYRSCPPDIQEALRKMAAHIAARIPGDES